MTVDEISDAAIAYATTMAINSGTPSALDQVIQEIETRFGPGPDAFAVMAATAKFVVAGPLDGLILTAVSSAERWRDGMKAMLAQHLEQHPELAELPDTPTEGN